MPLTVEVDARARRIFSMLSPGTRICEVCGDDLDLHRWIQFGDTPGAPAIDCDRND